MENIPIETLWSCACSGDIELLKAYYTCCPNGINRKYRRFGEDHSLIMGAFRNNQIETVKYLMSVGETISKKEKEEIGLELERFEIMKKLMEQ